MGLQNEYNFTISLDDIDSSLLAPAAGERGTPAFREAVSRTIQKHFEGLGGRVSIVVGQQNVEVLWSSAAESPDPLEAAVDMLKTGKYEPAIMMLRLLLSVRPDDAVALYNLGMALSDKGRLDEAISTLRRAAELAPDMSNAYVAIGVAFQRKRQDKEAVKEFRRAVEMNPKNPYAQRNYGGCLLRLGEAQKAVTHLLRATELNPTDQRSWFGLGQAHAATGDAAAADTAYLKAINTDEYSEVADLARQERSKIANHTFRTNAGNALRMDAVMYCLDALQKFALMPRDQVQRVTLEIAMLGMTGLDVNDPTPKYRLKLLPGEFSGLHLVSIEFVGFRQVMPDANIGFDLSREYDAASKLYSEKHPKK